VYESYFINEAEINHYIEENLSNSSELCHSITPVDEDNHLKEITMVFKNGLNLSQYLNHYASLSDSQIRDVILDAARGLQLFHSINAASNKGSCIHRDIKPENIMIVMVKGKMNSVILDYGVAKRMDRPAVTRTGTGEYIPPEVNTCKDKSYNHTVDFWALGMTILYMHTKKLPPGTKYTLNKSIPIEAADFIDRCVKLEPGDRFTSAQQMLEHPYLKESPLGFYIKSTFEFDKTVKAAMNPSAYINYKRQYLKLK
jgi:serine/threonine protein kinase